MFELELSELSLKQTVMTNSRAVAAAVVVDWILSPMDLDNHGGVGCVDGL